MSSARSGASPSSRGGGDAFGEFGPRTGEPSSTQGTPVHVPNPPSTDGTPSTAYLERARSFAERMQASMASAVKGDPLYNTLASSPATTIHTPAHLDTIVARPLRARCATKKKWNSF